MANKWYNDPKCTGDEYPVWKGSPIGGSNDNIQMAHKIVLNKKLLKQMCCQQYAAYINAEPLNAITCNLHAMGVRALLEPFQRSLRLRRVGPGYLVDGVFNIPPALSAGAQ